MAKNKQRHNPHRKKSSSNRGAARPPMEPPKVYGPKPVVIYGKPFTLLEDEQKNTFEFSAGAWAPYEKTIAECRVDCMVKELPQKVNNKTRYEIRCPVAE